MMAAAGGAAALAEIARIMPFIGALFALLVIETGVHALWQSRKRRLAERRDAERERAPAVERASAATEPEVSWYAPAERLQPARTVEGTEGFARSSEDIADNLRRLMPYEALRYARAAREQAALEGMGSHFRVRSTRPRLEISSSSAWEPIGSLRPSEQHLALSPVWEVQTRALGESHQPATPSIITGILDQAGLFRDERRVTEKAAYSRRLTEAVKAAGFSDVTVHALPSDMFAVVIGDQIFGIAQHGDVVVIDLDPEVHQPRAEFTGLAEDVGDTGEQRRQ